MTILLLIAWVHGCIGIYFWLRLKPFFTRAAPYLLAAAVLIPTLSLLGVYQGGRSVEIEADDGEWRTHNLTRRQVGTAAEATTLDRITGGLTAGYLGLLALALAARGVRAWRERRGGMIALSYGNGKTVRVPKGLSVLEASLRHNVPHASVCGGRARCSTCRIRIIGDHGALPEPSQREAFVLDPCRHQRPLDQARLPAAADVAISPSSSSSPRTRTRRRRTGLDARPNRPRSAISSACSWTCAARPSSPRSGCRSTPSSSSTASSAPSRRP